MNKYVCTALIIILTLGCKNEPKTQSDDVVDSKKETNSVQDSLISKLTLDNTFGINDVRRYGVFPDQGIGTHPNTGNKKMDELLNLAEQGLNLSFPNGTYKTVLDLSNRKNVQLNFENAVFTGSILINGTSTNNVKNITLKGKLISYGSLSTSYTDKIKIDSLYIKNDKEQNISGLESSGCNIYAGTLSLYIDYLEIEGTGSDGDQYRYTPAALMIHGKSPAPYDILIRHARVVASDRHGAYLSGQFIDIETLNIQSFAQGRIDNMIPIAYTANGDEKKITGVWLNDFEDSKIDNLQIDTSTSPRAIDAVYLDSGNATFPSLISNLELKGNNVKIRKVEATNVEILE